MKNDVLSFGESCVTLSIVSHGDSNKILKLLDSLYSSEPTRKFQIILTDNLGKELPDLSAAPGKSITIIRNVKPQGFARNHNKAFKQVKTNNFCILNPDVIFTEEIFGRLIFLLETAKADIVTPLIVDSQGVIQDLFRPLPTPLDIIRRRLPGFHFSPIPPDMEGLLQPDWIAGTFMLLRSETFQKINGFDERYHLYFEDVDLCTRARLLNLKLLVDTSIQIQHDANRVSRKNLIYLLWHIQSAIRFYSSNPYTRAIKKLG